MPTSSAASPASVTPVAWRPLPWDSDLFGFPAARIDIDSGFLHDADLEETLAQCRSAEIRHVTARVDVSYLTAIHALERAGFQMLDGIQTLSRDVRADDWNEPDLRSLVRRASADDEDAVAAIARHAFVYDRFHADAALGPGTAARVHEQWARNCCRGQAADAVFVATRGTTVVGFITCSVRAAGGTIGLVATADSARRTGAGRAMTVRALQWFQEAGAASVTVGTQLANVPAARLYQSCGFRAKSVSLTFRKML